jgi:hypothetical protein
MEKIRLLLISTIVVGLSFFKVWDWQTVGIYAGSDIADVYCTLFSRKHSARFP